MIRYSMIRTEVCYERPQWCTFLELSAWCRCRESLRAFAPRAPCWATLIFSATDFQLEVKAGTVNRKFERPVTAQAAVLTELRQRIIRGEVAPGQAIRQEVLASELGVSRLPVREALVVLQSERLVDYTQHKGYVVAVLDEQDLLQTHELRDTLESIAIAQAIPQLTDEAINAPSENLNALIKGHAELENKFLVPDVGGTYRYQF